MSSKCVDSILEVERVVSILEVERPFSILECEVVIPVITFIFLVDQDSNFLVDADSNFLGS